jgi:formate dehydrogenase (NADP+) alpha subunit
VEGIEQGKIKGLYLLGSNPLVTAPGNGRIRRALEKLELLIVQDISLTATAQLADVVLPASAAAEKSGSFTTTDHRVQYLDKAVAPPGSAREDWAILADLYQRLSGQQQAANPKEIMREIKSLTPGYAACSGSGEGRCVGTGLQYKLPVAPLAFVPPAAISAGPVAEMTLLVGPLSTHNGSTTTRSANNMTVTKGVAVEISAADATNLGITAGSCIKLTSVAGSLAAQALISDRLPAGLLFAPAHFAELNANALLTGNANQVAITLTKD